MADFTNLFHVDRLSLIILLLVFFVSISIGSYSIRYLKGDKRRLSFFLTMTALVLTISVMVCADHIVLFLLSWGISNILLTQLMVHKRAWEAAKRSSILASGNFALGFIFLAAALFIFYRNTGETSIQALVTQPIAGKWPLAGGLLLLLSAMTQSAIWPFHRWLTSSLNSPTPVSAIMHAGLVNGGGFLLARFMPLLAGHPALLHLLFAAGIATALLGTLWKLMQSDIKRMLACSTMGQMGFMVAQCGLGLFPAAVAHLCFHGLFKAYLFLGSGSAAKEQRLDPNYPPSFRHFSIALLCGVAGAYMFSIGSGKKILVADTNLVLIFIAMITGTQFALPIVRGDRKAKLLLATGATAMTGLFYGFSVHLIEKALTPLKLSFPQPLNALHFSAVILLLVCWLAMLFFKPAIKDSYPGWLQKKYVQMLNASQPHPGTITACRNKYQFK
ncbi:MAG: proton-conducting membrane transporter [Bacteroidetes bacterium]|nr:proton-conducting membrane transporter [Bacteroidota bacterium]